MRKVTVKGSSVEYDILIGRGLLEQIGEEVKKRIQPCKAAIVTDSTVAGLYLYVEQVELSLQQAGFSVCRFVYPAGEASKHIGTLSDLLEFLAEEEMTRQDIIVAVGGGVTGDMAGFAAAIYQRGIRFVQVPTTFLAAVDSSVGGKTAIDLKAGKNMAGAFYPPHLVLCDIDTLSTLPYTVFADGIAETLKYGVIGNADLFMKVAMGNFYEELEEIIETCVKMKRDIVEEDEFDTGVRQLLNLGHTLGHAIEKESAFTISHGEAVAIGMHLMAIAAEQMGIAEIGLAETIRMALDNNYLPAFTIYTAEELIEGVLRDKKRRGGEISFVFPVKIGECTLVKIPVEEVTELMQSVL